MATFGTRRSSALLACILCSCSCGLASPVSAAAALSNRLDGGGAAATAVAAAATASRRLEAIVGGYSIGTLTLIIFLATMGVVAVLLGLGHACAGGYPKHQLPTRSRVSPDDTSEADRVFGLIDADKNGMIELAELAAYLDSIGEVPSLAHRLLMSLDSDGDGLISKAEWREGWRMGAIGAEGKLAQLAPSRADFSPVSTPGH
jgi:hypothetical protein